MTSWVGCISINVDISHGQRLDNKVMSIRRILQFSWNQRETWNGGSMISGSLLVSPGVAVSTEETTQITRTFNRDSRIHTTVRFSGQPWPRDDKLAWPGNFNNLSARSHASIIVHRYLQGCQTFPLPEPPSSLMITSKSQSQTWKPYGGKTKEKN